MTEALNTHGQGQPTNVETPRPSAVNREDLSESISRGRNLSPRQLAARLVLVGAMLGSGKLALDSTPTSGQEPSAAPSIGASFEPTPSITPNPITGLLPCPTHTPEPGETPLPDRTIDPGIGLIGEEALAQTGADIFVSAEAQEAPSEAPASIAPASPAASEQPRTAVNPDCEPKPLPALDIEQEKNKIINQKDKQIKAVKYGAIDKSILGDPKNLDENPGFWGKYEAELSEYTVTTGLRKPLTREYLVGGLKNLKDGFEGVGDNKGAIMQTRQETAAAAVKLFVLIAEWTQNPNIRREALRIADMMFDHGVKGINTTQSYEENLDFMKYLVEDMFFVE